jgi:hypothetical protein
MLQDCWNVYPVENDPDFIDEFNNVVSDEDWFPKEDDNFTPNVFDDTYLHLDPQGGGDQEDVQFAKVTKQLRDKEGRPIGMAHDNPLLGIREYKVEFLDGHQESLSANITAQHMFSQVDEEGHRHLLLDDIADFRKNDTAINKEDAFVKIGNGIRRRGYTTQGCELLCQLKDGSTYLVALKDIKNSYPVQVADHAVKNCIDDEPAFACLVPTVLKK